MDTLIHNGNASWERTNHQGPKRRINPKSGDRFGQLVIIEEAAPKYSGKYLCRRFLCSCDCGNTKIIRLQYLTSGHTKSCGCRRKSISAKVRVTHGACRERLHATWSGMLQRCRDKNFHGYKNYGGRGITFCQEWADFKVFRKWALSSGYSDDLTIERVDVNGNYCPENCTWIPKSEQSKNRRCCKVNRK